MPRSWLFLSEAFFKMLAEDANKLDGLDTCIDGITSDGYLIYNYIKLIDFHVEEHGMTEEESYEYVDYNILGLGGEGYLSFSIAGPTGEGVTTPNTFTRERRCSMIDELRVV